MPSVVRPKPDLPTLGRLGALLVQTHHDFDPKRFIAATPRTEKGYASFSEMQLTSPDAAVFVADRSGEVIGYNDAGVEADDWMSLRAPPASCTTSSSIRPIAAAASAERC